MPNMDGFQLAEWIKHNPGMTESTVMMLTSAGCRGDANRCRELGISSYLTKPIKQSELLEAILKVIGMTRRDGPERPLVTRYMLGEKLAGGKRAGEKPSSENRRAAYSILVAEDNPINATLASRLIAKEGHSLRLANNGKEALAASQEEPFDLILMDIQMPEMDGFEATAAIRAAERGTGRHIPIIALTAHAMTGDKERCLEAGMDGYVTKPIRIKELREAIATHAPKRPSACSQEADVATSLDQSKLLAQFDNDPELLAEMVDLFLDNCPAMIGAIRSAVLQGDRRSLHCAAHSFKGAVGNFCIPSAFDLAQRLELLAERNQTPEAEAICRALEAQMSLAAPLLRNLKTRLALCES